MSDDGHVMAMGVIQQRAGKDQIQIDAGNGRKFV